MFVSSDGSIVCKLAGIVPFEENVRLFKFDTGGVDFTFQQGQFISLSGADGKSSYFAIASPPSAKGGFEILVKRGNSTTEYLFSRSVGDAVTVSGPLGKGFALDPYVGKNLLFVGVGTAIAPLRSTLLAALERRRDFNRISFLFGTMTPNHIWFGEEMDSWHEKGAEVHITVTYPDETWDRHSGFVQDILRQSKDPLHETVVYLCGMKEMVEETTRVLKERSIPEEMILLNF
ncbi:MAG: FAD-binding oxidoreductase [Leptospirillum sp.]